MGKILMNKMVTKKVKKAPKGVPPVQKTSAKADKVGKVSCNDKFCPIHGSKKLKMRGRTFDGVVIKKLPGRVTIQFERMLRVPKYERYEKRKTKLHARLPDCMKNDVAVGDLIQIAETRPISKMIHFVVSKLIKAKDVASLDVPQEKGGKK
jgi:small subunit ribosomal protein S17